MANKSTIKAVVVTVSDSRTEATDVSGVTLVGLLLGIGAEITEKIIVSDDFEDLRQTLFALTMRDDANLIVTTGGTGFSERDNTPEATSAVIEKEANGMAEAMRFETAKNTPMAMLSRGVCGIRNQTLIINLPGSPKGVVECFEVIKPVLPHAINLLAGKTKH
ncbi:MAG: MogA/MoaB family molybdenum cofactor biosynthesis protein [Acidobacteria bacterium]|jgi:molybdenum cofactor synthesis domain-containing protein|nr:MogA/MoaB family molybdenum cofactor biosynthesis protein [Acidobacteriota bacterium]MBA4120916.1 MogA/MoaB family molybdenum cofactor biosynthesis protein [Acidobacteriota bacterium]